jgi:hypothetical protein
LPVSIHAPARSATEDKKKLVKPIRVSIHAPREECDKSKVSKPEAYQITTTIQLSAELSRLQRHSRERAGTAFIPFSLL